MKNGVFCGGSGENNAAIKARSKLESMTLSVGWCILGRKLQTMKEEMVSVGMRSSRWGH
jgi:hypothetical protein